VLELKQVNAGYDFSRVLHGVDLDMGESRVVALLGRNGVGKTTALKAIMGLVPVTSGRILFNGEDLTKLPPQMAARRGIGYVPQGRRIFPEFTVLENLRVGVPDGRVPADTLEWIFSLFPRLEERHSQAGGNLSGGEQQMLAIGRALAMQPRLMLMDEPVEGLSPAMATVVRDAIAEARDQGVRILMVEQDISNALSLADYVNIMEKGQIKVHCAPEELRRDPSILEKYLGVRLSGDSQRRPREGRDVVHPDQGGSGHVQE
jgi:branched-chain amino acid transport system ATP-binding protein